MLHVYYSNRPDRLASALAKVLRDDPLPLFESETVLVPSTALARWLTFRLAEGLGIATQTRLAFPAAYVWQLFGQVLPEVSLHNPFDREAMQWQLFRLLGESRAVDIRHYLAGDDGTRQFELAQQLASLFDRYLVERPDWIAAWSAGRRLGLGADEIWQAELWQALLAALPPVAAEHPRERFLAALASDAALHARLPRRLNLFCVEAMPELYWQVFIALAAWLDVHVFVLAPCREYWGDIERLRERLRLEIERPDVAMLYETGHPLLASLGRARQHAMVRLADAVAQAASQETEEFVIPPTSLLGTLQRDILDLTTSTAAADATLQIHACHGAQREAEVLHDRLLEQFELIPDLQPADILILTPDIETYGPIVAAVLANAPPARRLPCTVADRPLAAAPLWRALRQLCIVAAGDLAAESVLALLEEPALRRAFEIGEKDLPRLRDWVAAAGIRWGVDGAARARRGLPADDAFTWRAGLDRLLLGVALPDAPERLWQGRLPVRGIEGEDAALLGRFAEFAETLCELHTKLGVGGTAPELTRLLLEIFARCLAPDESEEAQAQRLREALRRVGEEAAAAGCHCRLPLPALLRELDRLLAEEVPAQAFMSGSVTIAALRPGRPVAARIICLVGMNDGNWPRPRTIPGFDLLASHPRPGDRNFRDEDRYALLEALLCAGDVLIVTYTGRDPRSNLELPPAPPVAELIDVMERMTGCNADTLVVKHPLQPFGAAYFDGTDARLFSFDGEHCSPGGKRAAPAFFAAEVKLPAEETIEIDPTVLHRFFSQPVRYFLRERLGIHLEEREALLEIHEPFVPDALEFYRLREAQFIALREGQAVAQTAARLRARGWLPSGVAGELVARRTHQESLTMWKCAQPWLTASAIPDLQVEFAAHGVRLVGRIGGLTDQGLWRVRHGRLCAKDRLRLWIDHLLLNVLAPQGVPAVSTLIARDATLQLPAVPEAQALLADLLAWFRAGMERVLPFYPETAWAWLKGRGIKQAWEGDSYRDHPGERDDAYVALFLRDRQDDPLGEEFQTLAAAIFGPLRQALKVGDD
ncbi:exodeoxyribonuclease V subunit gamma [Sulfuricystis thermophila]|uniref:exodeoxyribonuclease V subunit gamma n=1 Tax=Sulfuricystis thermophila TaxID=2496847 RepID=UPI00103664C2|nr:exodeoxyribonuclease V subunit gamma [Sulfuricystis thermophila]